MKARNILAAISAIAVSITMCSCGKSEEELAAEKAEMEREKAEALRELSADEYPTGLEDGLHGICTTDDPRMQSVEISTSGGMLNVKATGNGDIGTPDYYGLFINIIPDEEHYIQVGFKDTGAETVSFVFDAGEAQQYDYGEWDTSTISSGVMLGTVPTERIPSSGDVEWNAALSINGRDEVTCPVDGKADLE